MTFYLSSKVITTVFTTNSKVNVKLMTRKKCIEARPKRYQTIIIPVSYIIIFGEKKNSKEMQSCHMEIIIANCMQRFKGEYTEFYKGFAWFVQNNFQKKLEPHPRHRELIKYDRMF